MEPVELVDLNIVIQRLEGMIYKLNDDIRNQSIRTDILATEVKKLEMGRKKKLDI